MSQGDRLTDILVRDVPDEVVSAQDARAANLGRSLHHDKDFDLIATITGPAVERLAVR